MAFFTKKPKFTKEKLAATFFDVAFARTKRYYEYAFSDNEGIEDTNGNFIELLIFNMFLIVSFSSDKITNGVFDIMYDQFIDTAKETVGLSDEEIISLKIHNAKMFKWYQGILEEYKNDNYLQQLSINFLSHITKTTVSAFTVDALEFTKDIAESIELIGILNSKVKIK